MLWRKMSWERGDGGVGKGMRGSGPLPGNAIFKQKPEGRDIEGTRWLFLQLRRQWLFRDTGSFTAAGPGAQPDR